MITSVVTVPRSENRPSFSAAPLDIFQISATLYPGVKEVTKNIFTTFQRIAINLRYCLSPHFFAPQSPPSAPKTRDISGPTTTHNSGLCNPFHTPPKPRQPSLSCPFFRVQKYILSELKRGYPPLKIPTFSSILAQSSRFPSTKSSLSLLFSAFSLFSPVLPPPFSLLFSANYIYPGGY